MQNATDNAVVTATTTTTTTTRTTSTIATDVVDENGNSDAGSQDDSTLDSVTSEGTVTSERRDDDDDDVITVSPSNAFVIDPHKTLSVSGAPGALIMSPWQPLLHGCFTMVTHLVTTGSGGLIYIKLSCCAV